MFFEGRIWKGKTHWLVEVDALDVITQGDSRSDALEMVADAIETISDRPGLKVRVEDMGGERIAVYSSDTKEWIALFLRRQRQKSGLTLMQVAERLGSNYPNAFARYEQGKTEPTIDKLYELLHALWPDKDVGIALGPATKATRKRLAQRRQRQAEAS